MTLMILSIVVRLGCVIVWALVGIAFWLAWAENKCPTSRARSGAAASAFAVLGPFAFVALLVSR